MATITVQEFENDENGVAVLVREYEIERDDAATVDDVRATIAATDLAPDVKDALGAVLDAVEAGG